MATALTCRPHDQASRERYPDEVGLLAAPHASALEIIGLRGEGLLETIQWCDVMEYSAFSLSSKEVFQFTVFDKGLLQFGCAVADIFLQAFEACLYEKAEDGDCYQCFTLQDPSRILPEEVSQRTMFEHQSS
jgi:hypothetical protein